MEILIIILKLIAYAGAGALAGIGIGTVVGLLDDRRPILQWILFTALVAFWFVFLAFVV